MNPRIDSSEEERARIIQEDLEAAKKALAKVFARVEESNEKTGIRLDSPAEERFYHDLTDYLVHMWGFDVSEKEDECKMSVSHGGEILLVHIQTQKWIKNHRVDFVIITRYNGRQRRLVVEIDGYQYHKDKFIEDRKRDRELMMSGYRVMRVAAIELWAGNEAVRQIGDYATSLIFD